MLYYELKYAIGFTCIGSEECANAHDLLEKLNEELHPNCVRWDENYALATNFKDDCLTLLAAVCPTTEALQEFIPTLENALNETGLLEVDHFLRSRELTVKHFIERGSTAHDDDLCKYNAWSERNLGLSYCTNYVSYTLLERTYISRPGFDAAKGYARNIMADRTMLHELERIYSPENAKRFYSHPVHYKITAGTRAAAGELLNLLIPSLKVNGRLPGTRTQLLYNIPSSSRDDDEISCLVRQAQGSTVVLELNCADEKNSSDYEDRADFLASLVRKYGAKTLFIFIEITGRSNFAKPMLKKLDGMVDIIELKEGVGDATQSLAYLRRLVTRKKINVSDEELLEHLGDAKEFKASEVQEICQKWYSNAMKTHIYKAYKNVERKPVKELSPVNNPYKELQQMVGLTEVKRMVDEIINTARMQKLRTKLNLKVNKTSLHACFTGNPGCAKTTVARLLAQILKKEGILETGNFVEVGRADLVGRYVGWTAKITAQKFREAAGGILFVDECYSLADDSNSFGAEAINTIVQQMENNRDNVIVIFAGYPQKVADFLAKNEGLRSRISFHINFPDYKTQDLTDIFHLMAKEQGYTLTEDATAALQAIFTDACCHEEFGNGRFVRNLLEQAVMCQARRLFREKKHGEISREEVQLLTAADFQVNAGQLYKKAASRPMGFYN